MFSEFFTLRRFWNEWKWFLQFYTFKTGLRHLQPSNRKFLKKSCIKCLSVWDESFLQASKAFFKKQVNELKLNVVYLLINKKCLFYFTLIKCQVFILIWLHTFSSSSFFFSFFLKPESLNFWDESYYQMYLNCKIV